MFFVPLNIYVIVQSLMEEVLSHKSLLDQLIILSRQVQSHDPSVSAAVVQITGRFHSVQTGAKVC